MTQLDLSRSYTYFNPDEAPAVDIIGAGATGSRVFEQLISLGVTDIRVFDFDVVDPHNIGNQLYTQSDVGNKKVEGLRRFAEEKLGGVPPHMHFHDIRFRAPSTADWTQRDACPKISRRSLRRLLHAKQRTVFLLVDSMDARRKCFEFIRNRELLYNYMIETRMGPTHGFSYVVPLHTIRGVERWFGTLIDDSEAQNQGACGNQITVASTAQLLSSIAVSSYINIAKGAHNPFYQGIYTSPFFHETED